MISKNNVKGVKITDTSIQLVVDEVFKNNQDTKQYKSASATGEHGVIESRRDEEFFRIFMSLNTICRM